MGTAILTCTLLTGLPALARADWGDPLVWNQFDSMDSRTAMSWRTHSGSYYYLCADDFVSTARTRISEIRVAGVDDPYPLGVDVYFWADVPATQTEDSHPGALLYQRHLGNAAPGDPHQIGWYAVGDGTFRVAFAENDWFYAEGSPENPVVYWVGVQVYHDIFGFEHFHWKFRNPAQQTAGSAVYSTDGTSWSHWGESPQHNLQLYTGTLPAGWNPVDVSFQLFGTAEPLGPLRNASFEIEHADYMPEGGWAGPLPWRGMPNHWAWRRQGHVNGHGEALLDDPDFNWVSDGDWSLYVFASIFGPHYVDDYLEFYQLADLTGARELLFDAHLKGGTCTAAYVQIDDGTSWSWKNHVAGSYYDQVLDLTGVEGMHEIRLGVRVFADFGAFADGHTFFDNLRLEFLLGGDLDGDGDVDLDDFDGFAACLGGPGMTTPPPGCAPDYFARADMDGDLDVDLADVADFSTAFTGAQE